MIVIVACEESQVVCNAFRKRGHVAYSCDILPTSGPNPNWHIQCDAVTLLAGLQVDMVIAFPPCTDLAVSGSRWFEQKRADGRQQASIDFFMSFVRQANEVDYRLCIENPVGIMSSIYRKPDQIIHPWQFGVKESKSTCLWLKGLPLLKPTDIVGPKPKFDRNDREERLKVQREWEKVFMMPPSTDRSKLRSKTYQGIADAMASQWG